MPKRKTEAEPAGSPFAKFARPTADECRMVHGALVRLHPEVAERKRQAAKDREGGCGDRRLVLDALVGTILSQNTTDVNSHRAFESLKRAFPTWAEVLDAPSSEVEEAIRSGGLAATKTARIKAILQTLKDERGSLSLEHLRDMPDDEVKAVLRRFKGVGDKTISCVLLFCLLRADFPVDTHVWKIALALNWVPKSADRDGTYAHLNGIVPDDIKYELHVLLVEHGKVYKNEVKVLREAVAAAAAYGVEEEVRALAAVAEEPPSASGSVKRERGAKRELGDTALKSEEMTATVKQERAVRVKREI